MGHLGLFDEREDVLLYLSRITKKEIKQLSKRLRVSKGNRSFSDLLNRVVERVLEENQVVFCT
jgi:hypothetical protein